MPAKRRSTGHAANAEAEDVGACGDQSRVHARWPAIPGTSGTARHAAGRSSAIALARIRGDGRETERLRASLWGRDQDSGPPVPRPAYRGRVAEVSLGTRATSRAADSGADRESLTLPLESRAPPRPLERGRARRPSLHRMAYLSLLVSVSFCFSAMPALRASSCISESCWRAASSAFRFSSISVLYCASSFSHWAELRRRGPASP